MKPEYIEGLSVVIPSYNRKKELCRLLDIIIKEDISNLHEIIIVDNSSDYDIDVVLTKYSNKKIRIVRNSINVKMSTNMVNTFLHCKTKWMWLISDDDVICNGAISLISKRTSENLNTGYLKFSTEGTELVGIEKNIKVDNLEGFIDYYSKEETLRRGNLVFVSNGVFNLEVLYPFLGHGFEFSYTYIGFLIPVFYALNNDIPVRFFEDKIVKYINPSNDFWSFKTVGLGLSTISHIPLSLNKSYHKKFLNITMPITYKRMFKFLLKENKSSNFKIYSLIYNSSYKNYLNFFQKILYYILLLVLVYPKIGAYLLKNFNK